MLPMMCKGDLKKENESMFTANHVKSKTLTRIVVVALVLLVIQRIVILLMVG